MTKEEKPFIKVWDGEVPPSTAPAEPKVTPVGVEPPANPYANIDPNLMAFTAVLLMKRMREMREEEKKNEPR